MSMGDRIKYARIAKGLTQAKLAEFSGVSKNAICNYEKGVSTPQNTDILVSIMSSLDVDANYIFQDEMAELHKKTYTPKEESVIKKYRALDEHGTDIVDTVLDKEYDRCLEAAENNKMPTKIVPLSNLPASAGTGEYLDYNGWDEISIPDIPENRYVDFAVRVHGDSMQPKYNDGDIVLVQAQNAVLFGDIGIFSVRGEGYIKKFGGDKLISLNPAYDDIELDESAICFGKVVGRL